jgi:hypothetical protein
MQVVRKRTVLLGTVVVASVFAPLADGLRIAPLSQRDGVVVHYRDENGVAIVAQPNGRLLAIHSLRKVTPGQRVTVQGIKWGTPTAGIKWSVAPRGIRWGIKWGRNGSYQSGLRKRGTRKAVWTPVRGPVVKRFGKKAVAIGTPGGVVVVRVALRRGSEGLAGQKSLFATELPPVGATVSVRIFFGPNGVKLGRDLRYLKPPVPGAALPVAGEIESIDTVTKTMVLLDDQDRAYPVRIRVALPDEFSVKLYTPGQEAAVEGTVSADGSLSATLIGPNGDFAAADDPNAVQMLTNGTPACTNAVGASCPPDTGSSGSSSGSIPDAPGRSSPSTPPPPSPSGAQPPPGTNPGGGPPPPATDPGREPAPPEDCTGRGARRTATGDVVSRGAPPVRPA